MSLPRSLLPTTDTERRLECSEKCRPLQSFCSGVLEQQTSIYDRGEAMHKDVGIFSR